ncbi:DnaJ C-terminal domain-containing protein [Desulforhopalus sp. IMCC35007]|uniref:DnaJ C-terminal domain-containing protein n=1 Tax=Desulforhopalus sp. IMCC35007 TaxID=2569543 RepID=UPI0010AEC74A|nr:DnaJ C-terminal domain-containing protein [Desulforhopalus sp. IMCC35007]TKB06881.1 J domain-containing protein [Desulforhopalus sp. IMCC35007]
MEFKDYYKILGVAKDASKDDIQRAYKKLARKHHPDVSKAPDAEVRFKEINEAQEVLKDPEKRKLYDLYGKDWERGGQQPPPHWNARKDRGRTGGPHSQSFRYGGGESFGNAEDFSDFFNNLFGGGFSQQSAGPKQSRHFDVPGESREAEIQVGLAEVFHGATRTITFQIFEAGADGQLEAKEKTLQVKIPRGVTSGSVIRLAGQGGKGIGRGAAGDLLLRILIAPDPRFHIVEHDLYTSVSISPWEAALGAKIPVSTVDGSISLTIPPGTQNGRKFRLRGKGIPKKKSGAGDIIIEVEIRVPASLSDEEKRLFKELQKTSSYNPREESRQRAKYHEKI